MIKFQNELIDSKILFKVGLPFLKVTNVQTKKISSTLN